MLGLLGEHSKVVGLMMLSSLQETEQVLKIVSNHSRVAHYTKGEER
jgi:hypothetical protein